jgi:23S rRNA (cytidine1920-2'-O)/16S rRNA (cytidine1409-2'-O)-methyltransferase
MMSAGAEPDQKTQPRSCTISVTPNSARQRLDIELVARGLVVSRARARDLVLRGEVTVDGVCIGKPALMVGRETVIELAPGAGAYVSRGALKLAAALDGFAIDVAGRVGLDIGAAQGGFTEVLLARGARKVYAVDNGRGQLAPVLRADARVISLEETDARQLAVAQIADAIGVIVVDVSFISALKVLPAVLPFAAQDAALVVLVKPQFETEPRHVGKDGVVRDADVRAGAVSAVATWIAAQPGWRVLGSLPSPILGGSGNIECLVGAVHDG